MLSIQTGHISSVRFFNLAGSLDALAVASFDEEILAGSSEDSFVVLEMSKLSFLSSAGIRKIVELGRNLKQRSGSLHLCAVNEQIRQVLQISGLLTQFPLSATLQEAVQKLSLVSADQHRRKEYRLGERLYQFSGLQTQGSEARIFEPGGKNAEQYLHVAMEELGFGLGSGCFTESLEGIDLQKTAFLSLPGFFACFNGSDPATTDYLLSKDTGLQGVYVRQCLCGGVQPDAHVVLRPGKPVEQSVLLDDLLTMAGEMIRKVPAIAGFCGFLDCSDDQQPGGIRFFACWIADRMEIMRISAMEMLRPWTDHRSEEDNRLLSLTMSLRGVKKIPGEQDFKRCLEQIWQQEDPDPFLSASNSGQIKEASVWVFLPQAVHDLVSGRMIIEQPPGKPFSDEWDLIIRDIYHDCTKVCLSPLHGGYAATTMLVDSYDRSGRKRLPTVLKLGGHPLISREEQRYNEFVRPFILNNSVSVLGATYYKGQGGICYNFLGINGPDTRLNWLRRDYEEKAADELFPLFDRIFKGILKPWYGQPKWETRRLFQEHSPLFPFFPRVVEDAQEILGIEPEEQYMDCHALGRRVLNPYWYLRHVWSAREQESVNCYTCVCHGDLNMQNILLDENGNIYIIDFSETRVMNAVSDFARLEPIFTIEMTRSRDEKDLEAKLRFTEALVNIDKLGRDPSFVYDGDDPSVEKAFQLVCRLRQYAKQVSIFEEDLLPYWLAVLEWTLPYVSYRSVNVLMQRQAAFMAGLICERLYQ
ncbi:MAG TPA: STAS domain-containing protein [Bacteroidales bacterium]|nr:STAS domain-containing protein [Bacteroidales bacterium]HSA44759.1 STAS domain-containing protein [Bacteroidales bacterium]